METLEYYGKPWKTGKSLNKVFPRGFENLSNLFYPSTHAPQRPRKIFNEKWKNYFIVHHFNPKLFTRKVVEKCADILYINFNGLFKVKLF